MTHPTLYRKRIIPNENVHLKDDEIVFCAPSMIITKWRALRPKPDLHHGISCYFLDRGIKVSKFFQEDGTLLYWYCDIVEYIWDRAQNTLTSLDLLADVVIYPDGFVKVIDLHELSTALDQKIISEDQLKLCLTRLDSLLQTIYNGDFGALKKPFDEII